MTDRQLERCMWRTIPGGYDSIKAGNRKEHELWRTEENRLCGTQTDTDRLNELQKKQETPRTQQAY